LKATSPRGGCHAISPYWSGVGLTAHRPGAGVADDGLGRLRDHDVGVGLQDLVEDRRVVVDDDLRALEVGAREASLLPPGFSITVTVGLSMSATVWYLATFSQRVIGALPLIM
jgi:hypothetical protein